MKNLNYLMCFNIRYHITDRAKNKITDEFIIWWGREIGSDMESLLFDTFVNGIGKQIKYK